LQTSEESEMRIPNWRLKADYVETCNCDCPPLVENPYQGRALGTQNLGDFGEALQQTTGGKPIVAGYINPDTGEARFFTSRKEAYKVGKKLLNSVNWTFTGT
jgi:hypothetical protein